MLKTSVWATLAVLGCSIAAPASTVATDCTLYASANSNDSNSGLRPKSPKRLNAVITTKVSSTSVAYYASASVEGLQ